MNESTDGVPVNGQTALSDRVKELRLGTKFDGNTAKAGPARWLPWVLCAFLAVGWAGFGIKWYLGTRGKTEESAATSQPALPASA